MRTPQDIYAEMEWRRRELDKLAEKLMILAEQSASAGNRSDREMAKTRLKTAGTGQHKDDCAMQVHGKLALEKEMAKELLGATKKVLESKSSSLNSCSTQCAGMRTEMELAR